jgi:lipid A 3-O-deacylase
MPGSTCKRRLKDNHTGGLRNGWENRISIKGVRLPRAAPAVLLSSTITLFLCITHFAARGQAIDNTLSFKNISNDKYLRFSYENDFFSATDIYYTWGMNAELVAPWVKDFPLSKVLFHPKYSYIRYGIGAEQDAYTPTDASASKILLGDRPFAASLFLKTFLIAINPEKKQRFSTTLSTGVIGPAAGGMAVQTTFHKVLPDNTVPEGWPNQIHNDVILNYQVDYEQQLISLGNVFSLDADGIARAGTLSDKAGVGTTMMLGYFDSPYQTVIAGKNHFRFYVYEHAQVNLIGYDATLQGGVFNRSSPYTIKASGITRVTLENRFGIAVNYRRVAVEYFQSYVSPEFNTGNYHVWGGVQLSFGL